MMTRYVGLIDGKPGAFGIFFPDCPGCTSMGKTVEQVLANAGEALSMWAEDLEELPKPSSIADLRRHTDVRQALAEGAALAVVPLIRDSGRPVKANLSVDAGLLAAIDEAAKARGLTRSAFLASAAREKIEAES